MKKAVLLTAFLVVAVAVSGLAAQSYAEEVRRYDAARAIVDKICLLIKPPLEEFPAARRYEILSGALASRGVTNFEGTDPDQHLTIGDMREIFDAVTFGEDVLYSDERSECPIEVAKIFSMDPAAKISLTDFQKVIGCFPYCDMGTAEAYTPPEPTGPLAPAPEETPEEPSTKI